MKSIHPDWKIENDRVKDLPHIASVLSWPLQFYQKRLEKIGFMGKNTRLLDAACGSGIWAYGASKINREVQAIDSSEKYLAVAQEINQKLNCQNLQFQLGKIEKLPYKDHYFDFIVCYNAWMYTQRKESLKEMDRVLKPGGKIYLGCIAGLGYYLLLAIQAIKKGDRGLVITALKALKNRVYMTKKEGQKLLVDQGFIKIKMKPIDDSQKQYSGGIFEILAQKKGKYAFRH